MFNSPSTREWDLEGWNKREGERWDQRAEKRYLKGSPTTDSESATNQHYCIYALLLEYNQLSKTIKYVVTDCYYSSVIMGKALNRHIDWGMLLGATQKLIFYSIVAYNSHNSPSYITCNILLLQKHDVKDNFIVQHDDDMQKHASLAYSRHWIHCGCAVGRWNMSDNAWATQSINSKHRVLTMKTYRGLSVCALYLRSCEISVACARAHTHSHRHINLYFHTIVKSALSLCFFPFLINTYTHGRQSR